MTNVVLIENCDISRNSHKEIINNSTQFRVLEDFNHCKSALYKINRLDPDIVLIDIDTPGTCGIESIKRIKRVHPKTKILVVTGEKNTNYVFDTLKSGALGFLLKNNSNQEILSALEQLSKGGAPLSPQISRLVVTSFYEKKFDELTERENDVLIVLSKGKSYTNIANELYVSVNTVKRHVRNIYEKLHVNSRDEIINLIQNKHTYLNKSLKE
ncbi:response regulator [Aquimarina mytili]|uniref:Response regulator transcription factor n=1 Tax=Aquimarina mytili TaxID=874423 RepID=A0A937A0P8_9FLAO|nr:response regulator transcription factor [Aquimarina mytili]MBL0685448.1 response regulator transcription factor [Aquimarina mytili]